MISLTRKSISLKDKTDLKDRFKSLKRQIVIAIGLATLFGLGWGFGLAASSTSVKELSFSFQLLFSIFVGLQGVFIFVLHGIRKEEARKQWKMWLTKASSKSLKFYTSNSTTKSTVTSINAQVEMSLHKGI